MKNKIRNIILGLAEGTVRIDQKIKFSILVSMLILIHSILLVGFYKTSALIMMFYNCFSILCYLTCFVFVRKEKYDLIFLFSYVEIAVHSVLATLSVGWEPGFAMYFIAIVPVGFDLAFFMKRSSSGMNFAVIAGIVEMCLFMICRYVSIKTDPLYSVGESATRIFYIINSFCTFSVLIGYMFIFYSEIRYNRNDLERKNAELMKMAACDALTGLYNRRKMNEIMERFAADNRSFGLIMLDIDHFKSINDTYGHDCGDAVLKNISGILTSSVGENDSVCRWGGEEFLIMCARDSENAFRTAEKIRLAAENFVTDYNGEKVRFTVTCGVSGFVPGMSAEKAVLAADKNLYYGKENGRNRVVTDLNR